MTPELIQRPDSESTDADTDTAVSHETDPTATDDAADPESSASESTGVELATGDGDARLHLPDDATPPETAAVAAAVAAHVSAEEEASEPEPSVDRWKLAQRLGGRRAARVRSNCTPGDAWKMAGRCGAW
jgi:hypothetical protein